MNTQLQHRAEDQLLPAPFLLLPCLAAELRSVLPRRLALVRPVLMTRPRLKAVVIIGILRPGEGSAALSCICARELEDLP
jgi:hypothetical protein